MSSGMTNDEMIERFAEAGTFSEQKKILLQLVESEDPVTLFQVRNLLLDIRDLNLLRLGGTRSLIKWGEETFFDLDFDSLPFTQKLNFLRIGCLARCRDEVLLRGLKDEDQGVQYETAQMIERLPEPPGREVLNMIRTIALNNPQKKVLIALVKALAAHPSRANLDVLNRISGEYSNLPDVLQVVIKAEKRMIEYQRLGAKIYRKFPFIKKLQSALYKSLESILKPRETIKIRRIPTTVVLLVVASLMVSGLAVFGISLYQNREIQWVAGSHQCQVCGLIQTPNRSGAVRQCITCGEEMTELDEHARIAMQAEKTSE